MTIPRASLVSAALVLVSCSPRGPVQHYDPLGPDAKPLRTAFNADTGQVRAIALASPTCGACLFGVSELERRWLEQRKQADVRLYVVWVPMLGAEERHVPEASRLASDSRVRQYWNGSNVLGTGFRPVLGIEETVWDVYLLYGARQVWNETAPPKPAFWMHQLHGVTRAPTLDASEFTREADRLTPSSSDHDR